MSATEPYDVILALRELGFETPAQVHTWLMAPNPDLGGQKPVHLVQLGRYDAVIEAARRERRRRSRPSYREVQ